MEDKRCPECFTPDDEENKVYFGFEEMSECKTCGKS